MLLSNYYNRALSVSPPRLKLRNERPLVLKHKRQLLFLLYPLLIASFDTYTLFELLWINVNKQHRVL